jgi:hypothetical protein
MEPETDEGVEQLNQRHRNVIATANAATPPRDRVTIANTAANGNATLREAAYSAYSCPPAMRSASKEKAALTTALRSVNPAHSQYALPAPRVTFMPVF